MEKRNGADRKNWEESDFPLLCQTCLGDNPYTRMMKEHDKECKTCNRPFTVFRWCPGAQEIVKKTEICQTCSQMKNMCQACLKDLEYGLPVQVRDAALRVQDNLPKSDVNKEIENSDGTNPVGAIAGKSQAPSDMLLKLARTTPYYKRNRPHICSFWVKGECKRGEECPYRHDRPNDPNDPLAEQNIRDRFHGTNDPVADKLIRRYHDMPKLESPEDKTITTLYVGNLGDKVEEKDLRDHFYQFGQIRSVTVVHKQQCAFVQFTERSSAEAAGEKSFNRLILKGQRLSIKWGRSQGQSGKKEENDGEEMSEDVTGPGGSKMSPDDTSNYFNLPPPPMMPPMMQRGPMPMRGPEPPMGNLGIRTPFGMGMNLRPSGPQHFQPPPHIKMQAPCPIPPPSSIESRRPASSAEHSRRSDGVVKPFGANIKTSYYPSQNPNRMGSGSKPSEPQHSQPPPQDMEIDELSNDISSAEAAGEKSFNRSILKGQRLNIKWGRSQGQSGKKEENDGEEMLEDATGPGELGPVPVSVVDQTQGNRYIGGTRNEEDMEIDELSNVLDELPSNQTSTQLPIQVRYNILGSLCPSGTDYTHGSLCVSGTTYTPGTVE